MDFVLNGKHQVRGNLLNLKMKMENLLLSELKMNMNNVNKEVQPNNMKKYKVNKEVHKE